jgi:hypothetical protein
MKFGKSIQDMLREVERQSETRKDYSAPTQTLTMEPVTHHGAKTDVVIAMKGNGTLPATSLAHRQIGEHIGVPAKYYDRMREEAPELLATNVNHWFQNKPSQRLVRTLDDNIRAFLSQGFRSLDYFDLCEAAIPTITQQGMKIVSCDVTETRLYVKAVDERVVRQVGSNRVVDGKLADFEDISPSLTISNSEVGMGVLSIERGIFQHKCKNMSIFTERALRKYHVGVRHELVDSVELLSDKTKNLTDAALWSQVKDVIANSFAPAQFDKVVAGINGMAEDKITADVVKVVEQVSKRFSFSVEEQSVVQRHLVEGANLSRWGLFNAITRAAEDLPGYDRATEFERVGGQIIELGKQEWKVLAEAA